MFQSGGERPGELREALVCIPKGHAKTTLMAALAVYHLLLVPNANVFVGASDKIQAGELYRFASHFIHSEPELAARAKVLGGTLEIRSRRDQGFIRVLASDDSKQGGKAQGFNPTLALIDELHAHANDSLFGDMRSGLFKRNGLLVTITTAGWDSEGALGVLRRSYLTAGNVRTNLVAADDGTVYEDAERGRLTVARKPSGTSVMLEWACRDDDDADDLDAILLANPATWVNRASLQDAKESLTPWNFQRYRMNRWTLGYESWLPIGAWDALAERGADLDPDAPIVAALDMGRYRDTAALVVVQDREDKPPLARAWIWKPGGIDNPVPYAVVMDQVRAIHADYRLLACGFDPRYMDQAGEELADEGVAMELIPQSLERQSKQAADLRQAILEARLRHDGDPLFASHVVAAIAREVGSDRFKLEKPSRTVDIDACEALAMAWSLLDTEEKEPLVAWG